MEAVLSIIGAVTGVVGMILGIIGFRHGRMIAITDHFSYNRDKEFIEARELIFSLPKDYDPEEVGKENGKTIAIVTNHYNLSGLLVRKGQLPKWLFTETAAGDTAVRIYTILEPYINYRRETSRLYANQFEYLRGMLQGKNTK